VPGDIDSGHGKSGSFVKRIISGALFALFCALLIGALTVFGLISMTLGHVFMICAAIVGTIIIFTELFPMKTPKHKLGFAVLFWTLFGGADYAIVRYKASELISTPRAPAAAPRSIDQKAQDSDCSNTVAGGDANIKCSPPERDHGKKKASPSY
jgi:hypothetical protein